MITFTKEQIIASAHARIEFAEMMLAGELEPLKESTWSIELELARIALASLEAEAVAVTDDMAYAFHHALSDSSLGADEVEEIKDGLRAAFANVTAPPAPVSVPDENGLLPCPFCGGRPEEDAGGCSEYDGHEHQDYSINCKSCGAEVYCAVGSFEKADIPCSCHHNAREVCVEKWNRRAAMLQGAEPVTTAYKLPEGWVAVPVEPTEDMIVNGFESEPDESFSDADVWEAYESMSGCQQAAHRAKLCWAAMIAAAPKQEVK